MISTDVVAEVLNPLRERFAAQYPVLPEWRYWFKRDEFGDEELFVEIEILEGATVAQLREVRETVRAALRADAKTSPYFPYVRYQAILPAGQFD